MVPRRCDDPAPLLPVREELGSDLDGKLVYQDQRGAARGVQVRCPVDRPVRVAEIPPLVDSQEAQEDDAWAARSAPGHDKLNDVAEPDPLRQGANERLKARDDPVEEAKREAPERRHPPSIGGPRSESPRRVGSRGCARSAHRGAGVVLILAARRSAILVEIAHGAREGSPRLGVT